MRIDAEEARKELGEAFATPALFVGIVHLLEGDPDQADLAFEESAELGEALGQTVDQVLALAERSLLAADHASWGNIVAGWRAGQDSNLRPRD